MTDQLDSGKSNDLFHLTIRAPNEVVDDEEDRRTSIWIDEKESLCQKE